MTFTPTDPAKAEVRVTGTAPNQSLDFYIPAGSKGDPGGIVKGALLASTDLNTVTNDGVYRVYGGANITTALNFPATGESGVLFVSSSSADQTWIDQIWRPIGGNSAGRVIYRRQNRAGTWSAWFAQTSARVDQTAGRAIYQWDDLNNREQLVYGDTGQRDVSADAAWNAALFNAASGVAINSGNVVRLQRVGNVVSLHWAYDKSVTGSVYPQAAFPTGFRPAHPIQALGSNSGMAISRIYHGGGSSFMGYNSTVATPAASVTLNYVTTDSWPTALPGAAIGSIPNA